MTLAILLSIEAPYVAIDQVLGGFNLANLVLRFVIFAALFFVGVRTTRGFGDDRAYRTLTGPVGKVALAVTSLAVIAIFAVMDSTGSSAGLVSVSGRDAWHYALVEYYGAAGRAYPAFVALALLPVLARAAANRHLPMMVRVAAGFFGLGSIVAIGTLFFPMFPDELGPLRFIMNYTAILCFVVGLVLIWTAKVLSARSARRLAKYTEK
ncbi:hypothetical protein [Arthrobacter ulcerisalmonis]